MTFLKNLRIGTRLSLGFASLIILGLVAAGIGIERIGAVRTIADRLGTEDAEMLALTQGWLRAIESNTARTWVVFFASDPAVISRVKEEMQGTITVQSERIKRMSTLPVSPEAKRLIEEISRQRDAYQAMRGSLLKRKEAGENVNAEVVAKVFPAAKAYFDAVNELVQYQDRRVQATKAEADASAMQGVIALALGSALAMIAGIALSLTTTRSVVVPVRQAQLMAEAIADGDLTNKFDSPYRDELGQLMRSMGKMVHSLHTIVGAVRSSSDSIATGSNQIATGNADLSQRTEKQASSLQETAASMEELTAAVDGNANTARTAEQIAGTASDMASRGGVVVEQVVSTMEVITASSRKIADIIGVIDGIAFQTNILALNAAVEAARAGENGRGFAVVASEVRGLAQRSAAAAKEIKDLITDSVEKVEAGSHQVNEAGRAMADIVVHVKRVHGLIGEISTATNEQTRGIGQVSGAMTQLDHATQQNAALVEESAAAADSLRQQAQRLVDAVSAFKLERTAHQ